MSVHLVSAVVMLLILDLCEEQTSAVIFSYGHMGGDIYLCRYVVYISILSLLISSLASHVHRRIFDVVLFFLKKSKLG